jgi:hypothetical protein
MVQVTIASVTVAAALLHVRLLYVYIVHYITVVLTHKQKKRKLAGEGSQAPQKSIGRSIQPLSRLSFADLQASSQAAASPGHTPSTPADSSALSNINVVPRVQHLDLALGLTALPLGPPAPPAEVNPSTLARMSTGESRTFLPGGKDSGDTPRTAVARRERNIVQRHHRRRERGERKCP